MRKLGEVVDELAGDMERGGWAGRTVTLKYKLDTFQVFTRAKSLDRWVRTREDLLAIGTELVLAEGSLRLRLLGLRVTKLKDLRAPESSSGIKRFLQAGKASEEDGSAKKRRRHETPIVVEDDELPSVGPSTVKYDHEIEPETHRNFFASSPEPSPEPDPAPQSVSADPPGGFASPIKAGVADELTVAEVMCPICGTFLAETSDRAVNEHVDFCLSKSAIRAAAHDREPRPSLSPKKRSSGSGSGSKPTSRTNKRPKERGGLDGFLVRRDK
jgi:DNA polymerase kappa